MASTTPSKSKSKSAKSSSSPAADATKKRRRTGASSRGRQRRFGDVSIINPVAVSSPQDARDKLYEGGRARLASGSSLRVDPLTDLEAADNVLLMCSDHAAAFAERMITEHLVGGARLIVRDLDAELGPTPAVLIASKGKGKAASADAGLAEPIDDAALAEAYNFASARRKAIGRIAQGPGGAKVRATFGIGEPMQRKSVPSVIRALRKLARGRAARKGGALAGRCLTAADIKTANSHVKKLSALRKEGAEARRQQRLSNQNLQILQAALETFYDLYTSACHLVFEHDNVQKLEALKLVPRRVLSHPPSAVEEQDAGVDGQANGTSPNASAQTNGSASPSAIAPAASA